MAAEPSRRARTKGPPPGALLVRFLAPAAYGAALVAGLFTPTQGLGTSALVVLAAFIAYCLWRLHGLVTRPGAPEIERSEAGFLAMLAVSTALEVAVLPAPWAVTLYSAVIVGLSPAVPVAGLLVLPLAAVSLWGAPGWAQQVAHLELLALAAGLAAAFQKRRRARLTMALQKLRLDAEHLGARTQNVGSEAKGDLSRLDDVLYDLLHKVKENTGAHGAVLAVKTPRDELFLRELVSDSLNIREKAVLNLEGTTFQWVLQNNRPLLVARLRDPGSRLGYYGGAVAVKSFLGVPLGDPPEGVLGIDSLREDAFTDAHQNMLKVASHQVSTILDQIRALEQVRREAWDFKHLHEFSKRLGTCGSVPDLVDLALAAVRERLQPDFSAVALVDGAGELRLEALGEAEWAELRGRSFQADEGLAGWVLTSGPYLHYGEGRDRARRPLFGRGLKLPEFPSLVIHALAAHGESLGVLCLASRSPRAFDPSAVAFSEVVAQQGAQGILQIRTLEQLKALAATDGLTGLANRRVFLDRLAAEAVRSRRYPGGLALILLDVDHFKKVNDTHGHPAGDEVLRRVAQCLRGFARETDLVARYGGEEFAALLPSTDLAGARILAERVRAGIEALAVTWDGKTIPVRASLGVSTLEGEKDTPEALVARADQALYAAKQGGRNRVTAFDEIREYAAWK
ncbi:MAG: sensor domain-containing diguanylate cyclase [Deferrisomatales bacterium]